MPAEPASLSVPLYDVLSQVVELIENKQKFGITTHIKPDGDGVGSSLGLMWLLRSLGKSAEVIVRGDIPLAYRSLPGADEIRNIEGVDDDYDAVFVIECSDLQRPGIEGLDKQFTVNIDHHATGDRQVAQMDRVEGAAVVGNSLHSGLISKKWLATAERMGSGHAGSATESQYPSGLCIVNRWPA